MSKILDVFDRYNIEYKERGTDVGVGNVNIKCPWCVDDKGMHLGIKVDGSKYGCWRNPLHRGNELAYVLKQLLHIPLPSAYELLGKQWKDKKGVSVEEEEFMGVRKRLLGEKEDKEKITELELLPEFKEVKKVGVTRKFWEYIRGRGFSEEECEKVINKYKIKCCLMGDWEGRLIIPIIIDNKLVSWIGRTIYKDEELRYKNLLSDKSVMKVSEVLFNLDEVKKGGQVLFICEGMFDSIKVQTYLPSYHAATCLFTKNASKRQLALFYELKNKYQKFVVVLDKGEDRDAFRLLRQLEFLGNKVKRYELTEAKDPGELIKEQVDRIVESVKCQ